MLVSIDFCSFVCFSAKDCRDIAIGIFSCSGTVACHGYAVTSVRVSKQTKQWHRSCYVGYQGMVCTYCSVANLFALKLFHNSVFSITDNNLALICCCYDMMMMMMMMMIIIIIIIIICIAVVVVTDDCLFLLANTYPSSSHMSKTGTFSCWQDIYCPCYCCGLFLSLLSFIGSEKRAFLETKNLKTPNQNITTAKKI